MKNGKTKENNTLYLTDYCFKVLLEKLLEHFQKKNGDISLYRITQLYGFGNYDPTKPNLRSELEKLDGGFINGKYLYDKIREIESGKSILKLNGYYKNIFFRYIGYEHIEAFTKNEISDKAEQKRQLDLIKKEVVDHTHYYISYHFGENKEVIKGQVTILNNWKNVQYKYIYFQTDGSIKAFFYHGKIIRRADILHIKTKTWFDNKMIEGGEDILYTGHNAPESNAFLLGTYSAFDMYNKVIAGKLIFEKCASKEEMVSKSLIRKTPGYIAQEIRNMRLSNTGIVPSDSSRISAKSPFSSTYEKVPGLYNCCFYSKEEELGNFKFSIDKQTFRLTSITKEVVIEKDDFEIISNGSVIHFSFQITGIILFSRLEIFFKTYYLNKSEKDIQGVYSGLDIENRLISGTVRIVFED